MNAARNRILISLALAAMVFLGCSSTTDPSDQPSNQLGGETSLELTEVGNEFDAWLDVDQELSGTMNDSTVIIRSESGLVTFRSHVSFDSAYVVSVDSALGTSALPTATKLAIVDRYLKRFGATIDTSDWSNVTVDFELKLRITSEGIQEYISSGGDLSKPQTIVRYSANVGEVTEFTDAEGVKVKRTVVSKSVDDDYDIGFWRIKVIEVEQVREDPIIEKVTYITNHKFGLVAVAIRTKTGKVVKLGIWPPNL